MAPPTIATATAAATAPLIPAQDEAPERRPPRISGARQQRVRFREFSFHRAASGKCTAQVTLEWEGRKCSASSAGPSSPLGELRISAEAALLTLAEMAPDAHFDLLGIKHVRAFDSNVIVVSLAQRDGERMVRLVGCALSDTDINRGAALAVLNATNRVFGNFLAIA